MAAFQRLAMHTDEARRLAEAAGRADVDWYLAWLRDGEANIRNDFIARLRREHAAAPDVAERLCALAAPAIPGQGGAAATVLRLRASLALLALGIDAGLAPVIDALEGKDAHLRSIALAGIPDYQPHLRWPDPYYVALFASCERILDSTRGEDRARALGVVFDLPIPALAAAMRGHLAGACEVRRRRAALWLLCRQYESEARTCISQAMSRRFPQDRQARRDWYRGIEELMRETAQCYRQTACAATRTWAAATVLILLDRLVAAARVNGEPDIGSRWFLVSGALSTIKDEVPPSAQAVLARWAAGHRPGTWQRARAFAHYASHAGTAAVGVLLRELERGDVGNQAILVRKLRMLAPRPDYRQLASLLRARLDAIPPRRTAGSGQQDTLAAIAATLVLFAPEAAVQVEARLPELGRAQQREVRWALQGLTTQGIAALLASAGALAPFASEAAATFDGDGHLVRQMLHRQQRLVVLNTRDDTDEALAVRVAKALAAVCVPPVTLDAVAEEPHGVRFVHARQVYAITGVRGEEQCGEAAGAFNAFLADIGHPQRVFAIGDDQGEVDNDIGAFFCADPARMAGAAARLGFPAALAKPGTRTGQAGRRPD